MEAKPKSRKVASYLKAHAKWKKAFQVSDRLHNEMMMRYRALNGGQLAEATRALAGGGHGAA